MALRRKGEQHDMMIPPSGGRHGDR
jgi:hypothetical protein